jgi:mannitol/fructose-specific phosphotransferase system IIA component
MLELTVEQISMGQVAVDKSAALHLLADKLVADGLVAEGYLSGLQAREAQGSTFLGQGIAIPHGTPETRDQVFSTGVRLLQFPEGVDWGDGQIVYLAIGIAAKSDEHLRLLQLLTRALGETDLGQALRRAGTAEALLKLLQGAPQELALDAQMISLGVSADDFEELVWRGARLLRQADCVRAMGLPPCCSRSMRCRWVMACGGCIASRPSSARAWRLSPPTNPCATSVSPLTVCSAWPAWVKPIRPCSNACAPC